MTSPLRLKNDKIIEHNIHAGPRKCTGQQANITGGQSGILHLRNLKSVYIKWESVTDTIGTQMINGQSYFDIGIGLHFTLAEQKRLSTGVHANPIKAIARDQ